MEQSPQNTALLVMDMQAAILQNLPDATPLISSVSKAITNARDRKIPVIYVTVGFRTGTPEISINNKGFTASKQRFTNTNTEDFMKIHPDLPRLADEITVTKRRVSAFTGSDLEVVL